MSELVNGLRDLRVGAMLNLISVILVLASVIFLFATIGGFPNLKDPSAFIGLMAIAGTYVTILIVAAIIGLVGFVFYFKATGHLKRYDPDYGIGRIGMVLQIVGLILMLASFGLIFLAVSLARALPQAALGATLSMLGLIIVGAIVIIVGSILFSVMLIRLGKVDSGFKIAGILYLIGIILNFIVSGIGTILGIVSTILIYTSSGRSLERLS